MAEVTLSINGKRYGLDIDPEMPLLWAIRDYVGLTGTKFSCGIGQCGSCTVFIDNEPARACLLPAAAAEGKKITTIEGLSASNNHPVQQAWIEEQVPQCGYCQTGQIMNAIALLKDHSNPTDEQIDTAMRNVLCRCGTYPRIRRAIKSAAKK